VPVSYNNFSAYMFARSVYSGVGIALCIGWALQRLPELRMALLTWTGSLTYVALFSITHGGRGPSGFMGDENDMALACCTAFPFAFFGFERLTGWKKIVSGVLAVVFVVAIVVSFSRGGFVGLAAVALFCFYFSRKKLQNIAVGIAAIVAFMAFAPAQYIDEIRSIQETQEGTAETRRFLWDAAIGMWKDSPIIGVGGGGSSFLVGKFQPRDAKYDHPSYRERNWSGQAVHSLYFQLLAEMGSVGVALYGAMVYLHFRTLNRLRRDVARETSPRDPLRRDTELYAGALAGGMIGFLAPAAFISVLHYPYVWYLSAFALALDRGVRAELARRVPARHRAKPEAASEAVPGSPVPACPA
jgi:O-antigen ligase